MGSSREACQAGTRQENAATKRRTTDTAIKIVVSRGCTPYNMLRMSCDELQGRSDNRVLQSMSA